MFSCKAILHRISMAAPAERFPFEIREFAVVFLVLLGFTLPLLRESEQFFLVVVVICCAISSVVSFQGRLYSCASADYLFALFLLLFKVSQQQQVINSRKSSWQENRSATLKMLLYLESYGKTCISQSSRPIDSDLKKRRRRRRSSFNGDRCLHREVISLLYWT